MSESPLTPQPPRPTDLEAADLIQQALARTPARLLTGRSGPGYRTSTWLQLLADHAAARDAVYAELDLERDFGPEFVQHHGLFFVQSMAQSKTEFLMRPDLGRKLCAAASDAIGRQCSPGCNLQVIVGDGLSATAVVRQVPSLLVRLKALAADNGWSFGTPFAVRFCRVGILNDVGELLGPAVAILLIGERPGLATDESLSAYLAYQPRPGHTDAHRNLISNIHARGVSTQDAADRIIALAAKMMTHRNSGVAIKEGDP
ncbi:MAG: ethanolamine ammonia-lyase subunit EutC [Pirellulales bacterium]|nr:ethanolamine ammonia-lyase subunit EutC [Pirellulales bacterium]